MEYYKSNALYEYISAKKLKQFKYVVGNAWQLVYGDNKCQPKILVFAVGVPNSLIDYQPTSEEIEAYGLLDKLANKANLPVRYIRFSCDVSEVSYVKISDNLSTFSTLTMSELSLLFGNFGLPVSSTQTAKYLNDKISSAYHKWQRASLGAALTVSDIDLWKLAPSGEPEIIFELKRSYYELSQWKPFTDDYRNFQLVSNLCNSSKLKFKIIYNQRIKAPFQDKIDKLKIFSVDFSKNTSISDNGIIELKDLENIS